jgi:aromatic-L-amino-acid/L-tryptophan decarboxylase
MDPGALERAIEKDLAPVYPLLHVATIGTTGTTAVDPLREIGEICHTRNLAAC